MNLYWLVGFVILLGVTILVHELGHFWAALSVGIKVEVFSLGFGPRLFGVKRGDTDFRVAAIPLGGYVRMLGEQPGDEKVLDSRSFQSKARWQRAIVIAAGPLMNVILAIFIVTALFLHGVEREVPSKGAVVANVAPESAAAEAGVKAGDTIIQVGSQQNPSWDDILEQTAMSANHALPIVVNRAGRKLTLQVMPQMDPKWGMGVAGWSGDLDAQIGQVMKDSPAQRAGLQPHDLLVSVNDHPIASGSTFRQAVIHSNGQPLEIKFERDKRTLLTTVTPMRTNDPEAPWRIGIIFQRRTETVKLPLGAAFAASLQANERNATLIFQGLRSIVERRMSPKTLAGPIGMAQISGEALRQGPIDFLDWMAAVSLNLAILNLLPIPLLDGGTLLLLIIEMLLQREVSIQVRETVFKLGFVILMMVVVFVIYNDISRILTRS